MGARGATMGLGIHGEQGIAVTHRWWRRREDGGAGRGAAVARRRGDGWWRLDVQHGEDVATAVAASSKTVEARAMSHCDKEETMRWPAGGRGRSAAAPPWCTGRCSEDDDVERALGVRSRLHGGSAAMKAWRRWWRRRGCFGSATARGGGVAVQARGSETTRARRKVVPRRRRRRAPAARARRRPERLLGSLPRRAGGYVEEG